MTMKHTLRTGVFAAAVALSLGFGAAQALAAPGEAASAARCDPEACQKKCQTQFGLSGICSGRGCYCR